LQAQSVVSVSPMVLAAVSQSARQRHGLPALLSFFIPGLGQLVKGQFLLGFLVWVAMGVAGVSCMFYVGFVLLPVFWVLQIYDAYTSPDAQTKRELDQLHRLQRR
jgi:TM2 domain-containing membrane protein YozV